MTIEELKAEWHYRYNERLAMLCGANQPTEDQHKLAEAEADAAINILKSVNNQPTGTI